MGRRAASKNPCRCLGFSTRIRGCCPVFCLGYRIIIISKINKILHFSTFSAIRKKKIPKISKVPAVSIYIYIQGYE